MKVYSEIGLESFEAWSGGLDTKRAILSHDKETEFENYIEETYPDGLSETELNDLLWFEDEFIFEYLGMNEEETDYDITSLTELIDFINNGNSFEELASNNEDNNCEVINNEVYEDEDWNDFLRHIGVFEGYRDDKSIYLEDDEMVVKIDYKDVPNRFGEDMEDETIFSLDTIREIH